MNGCWNLIYIFLLLVIIFGWSYSSLSHASCMKGVLNFVITDAIVSSVKGTLLLPVWKAFTSTQDQTYVSDTSRNPLQSCLVFHSILNLLQKTSFWAIVNLSYDIILSYLVKNSIQMNMNRRGEKHVGAGQEKSPLFTKITKEMNQ